MEPPQEQEERDVLSRPTTDQVLEGVVADLHALVLPKLDDEPARVAVPRLMMLFSTMKLPSQAGSPLAKSRPTGPLSMSFCSKTFMSVQRDVCEVL
jgi:hypothetical protein